VPSTRIVTVGAFGCSRTSSAEPIRSQFFMFAATPQIWTVDDADAPRSRTPTGVLGGVIPWAWSFLTPFASRAHEPSVLRRRSLGGPASTIRHAYEMASRLRRCSRVLATLAPAMGADRNVPRAGTLGLTVRQRRRVRVSATLTGTASRLPGQRVDRRVSECRRGVPDVRVKDGRTCKGRMYV
jgi:hypothetical protein